MSPAAGPSSSVPPYPSSSQPPSWAAPAPAPWAVPPPAPTPSRHRVARTALVAVPALLVGAGAATVITLGIVGHHATTIGGTGPAIGSARHTMVGTLTATDGSTWTVKTSSGTVSVDVGPHTAFGTKAHPSSQTAFQDGDKVTVVGTHGSGGVDAVRVRLDGSGATTASR